MPRDRSCADVVAIDADDAARRVIEAQQQLKAGALAGAGGADHRDRLAAAHLRACRSSSASVSGRDG